MKDKRGFTLIEVLLALVIITISLTALIRISAQDIVTTRRIKEKTISHWVMMQGVAMVQLGLLPLGQSQEVTETTTMFGQRWYWRARADATALPRVSKITITVSEQATGPFHSPLIAYQYQS